MPKKENKILKEELAKRTKHLASIFNWLKPLMRKTKEGTVDVHKHNYFAGYYITTVLGETRKQFDGDIRRFPELVDTWERIKDFEEEKAVMLGLSRQTDAAMTKFVLSNKYKWSEKAITAEVKDKVKLKELFGFEE